MKSKTPSFYQSISRSIKAIDIADPIRLYIKPDVQIESIYYNLMESDTSEWEICIVCDNKKIYGYLNIMDSDAFASPLIGTAWEKAAKIEPEQIIDESFPVIDLLDLFLGNTFFLIKTGTKITHSVSWNNIDSLPVRIGLYTKLMELEAEVTRLLRKRTSSELEIAYIRERKISAEKLEKIHKKYLEKMEFQAKHTFNYRNSIDIIDLTDYRDYLSCTDFTDKSKLLSFFPDIFCQLPFTNNREFKSFFYQIIGLRNKFAHGNSIWDWPYFVAIKEFLELINELDLVIEKIKGID